MGEIYFKYIVSHLFIVQRSILVVLIVLDSFFSFGNKKSGHWSQNTGGHLIQERLY